MLLGLAVGASAAEEETVSEEIPPNWKKWETPDGAVYYQRPDGTTTWENPLNPPELGPGVDDKQGPVPSQTVSDDGAPEPVEAEPAPVEATTVGARQPRKSGAFMEGSAEAAPEVSVLPDGWKEWRTEDGKRYYEKPDGTTTWDRPKIVWEKPSADGTLTLTRYHTENINWANDFRFGGSLEYRFSGFFKNDVNSDERLWNDVIFQLFTDVRWNDQVRTYGKMELTGYLPQSDPRIRIIPEEAFLDLYLGPVDIRAGYQIYSWGVADLYNPTDKLNPRDYIDILNYEKEGILSLKVGYSFSNWTLEGIWIPLPEESYLPQPGWRFFEMPGASQGLPPAIVSDLIALRPGKSIRNPQFAARLRGTAGRFDLGFSYFYGLATVPQREVSVGTFNPVDNTVTVTVTEVFPREHTVGANMATTIKKLGLHLETAAVFPKDTGRDIGSADQFRFNYVVGGNYTWSDVISDHDIRFFLDFTHEIHRDEKSTNLSRIFQLSLLSRLEYIVSDDLKITLSGAYNFDDRDYIIRPRIEWGFYEGFTLTAGADFLGGPSGSFFDLFEEDDRGYAWLKYEF